MKRIYLYPFIIVLSLAAGTNLAFSASVQFTDEVLRSMEALTSKRIGAVESYQVQPYRFSRESARQRADAVFGRNPVAVAVRGKELSVSESEEEIVFSSGKIEYRIAKATGAEVLLDLDRYAVAGKVEKAVGEDDARRIAARYLQETFPEIKPEQAAVTGVRKLMDGEGQYDPKKGVIVGSEISRIAHYVVSYDRQLGKLPAIGSGEKIRIYLSPDGKVIGHSLVWRQFGSRRLFARKVVPVETFKSRLVRLLSENKSEKITVDRFYFGYFADGRFSQQRSMSPCYIVGYTYGPYSKRVLQRFDAYTGEPVAPPQEKPGDHRPKE